MSRRNTGMVVALAGLLVATTAACGEQTNGGGSAANPLAALQSSGTAGSNAAGDGRGDAARRGGFPIYSDEKDSAASPTLSWRGNAVGYASVAGRDAVVGGWVPGMDAVATCRPTLWSETERPTSESTSQAAEIDMIATASDSPVVVIAYPVVAQASGLDPESTRVYVQTIDLRTCGLGPRIDVLGAPVPRGITVTAPRLVAAGQNTVAVAPWPEDEESLPDLPALLGINPSTNTAAWMKKATGGSIGAEPFGAAADGIIDVRHRDAGDESHTLVDVETGTELYSAPEFSAPAARLGADRLVVTLTDKSPHAQSVISGGRVGDVAGGSFHEDAEVADDGKGNRILVGRYCAAGVECGGSGDADAVGFVGADNTVKQVMDRGRAEALRLSLLGASAGKLYVRTSSNENLTVGLDGKMIGGPYDAAKFPFVPVGERRIGGELYTLWRHGDTAYAIGKGGEMPPLAGATT